MNVQVIYRCGAIASASKIRGVVARARRCCSAVGTDRAIGSRMKAPPADYLSWVFAIGRIEATCQPFASRTNVWLIRNILSWGGLPGRPRVKKTGTRICMTGRAKGPPDQAGGSHARRGGEIRGND